MTYLTKGTILLQGYKVEGPEQFKGLSIMTNKSCEHDFKSSKIECQRTWRNQNNNLTVFCDEEF